MNRQEDVPTVLDAISILVLHSVREDGYAVIKQLVDNPAFSLSFQTFERGDTECDECDKGRGVWRGITRDRIWWSTVYRM